MVDLTVYRIILKKVGNLMKKLVNAIIKGINRCGGDCPCNNI